MTERLIVVTEVDGPLFLGLLKTNSAGPDRNPVTVFKRVLELLLAVYEYLVGAAFDLPVNENAIDKRERAVFVGSDVRVVSRRARIVKHNLIVGRATNQTWSSRG